MRAFRLSIVCVLFANLIFAVIPVCADEASPKEDSKHQAKSDAPAAKVAESLSAKEAEALDFAQQNHPDLVSLLQGLKQSGPKEYQEAIVALNKDADRLGSLKDKNPQRYAEQLAEWKLTSRIRLLAARLAVSDDADVEKELTATLNERVDLKLVHLRTERERLIKREHRLSSMIDELSNKEQQVAKELKQLKTTKVAAKSMKKIAKPITVPSAVGTVTPVEAKGEK